jgi:hypothetical protein
MVGGIVEQMVEAERRGREAEMPDRAESSSVIQASPTTTSASGSSRKARRTATSALGSRMSSPFSQ